MGKHSINLIQSLPQCQFNFNFNFTFTFPKSRHSLTPVHSNLSQFSSNNPSLAPLSSRSFTILPKAFGGNLGEEAETTRSEEVGKDDLLIVGPGVLGRLVAQQWRQEYPGCQVYGQTATTDHHDELDKLGIVPCVKGAKLPRKFPYVIFCAPPSRSLDYAAEVWEAMSTSWYPGGSFLFTSSSAPYDCADNGDCDELTPSVPIGKNHRADVLLKAESVVLEHTGCVLRLAGLYKSDRGAHTYWLNQGTSELRPDHCVNLIHYDDAASLSITILKKRQRGRIYLGCDNHPLSRQEIMDLVNASGKFSKKFEGFTGSDGVLGKRLNNTKTREELGWQPKYPSFAQFLEVV